MFSVAGCTSDEPATESPAAEGPTESAPEEPETDLPASADAGRQAFEHACVTCHDGTRVFLQPDGTDWSRVLETMESAHRAVLADAQNAAVLEYLANYEQTTGEKIISGKCVDCHDAARIFNQPSTANWEWITQSMVDKHSVALTREEQQAVIDYLSNR